MNPFEAIQYVGTPIALVAFVAAVLAWVYRGRLAERRKSIEAAPEAERARLLESTIRDFTTVPTDTLTQEQRYNLANKLIDERAARFKLLLMVSVIVALLFTAMIVLFTVLEDKGTVTGLVVRVHGPGGSSDFITNGEVTLDAAQIRETRTIGADGRVRFDNVPAAAYQNGVKLLPNVPGYHATTPITLTESPPDGAYDLALERSATRVFGTVLDRKRNPMADVVVLFKGGLVADTTDQAGTFSVMLPEAPGTRVPVRALKNGVSGYSDMITIPDDASLTIFFTPTT